MFRYRLILFRLGFWVQIILGFLPAILYAQQVKYVFLFIGDGMGINHIALTEAYLAAEKNTIGYEKLSFTTFPTVGLASNHALNQLITCSAAAGTALATGNKTSIGTLGMDASGKVKFLSVARQAREKGLKAGIITNVSINHATPAAFYAHQPNRENYYEIGLDLIRSNFDFFGGGGFHQATGKQRNQPSLYELAKNAGYSLVTFRQHPDALPEGISRVIITGNLLENTASLPFVIDDPYNLTLSDLTRKAINFLSGENGFFIMIEEGNLDWAAHVNDAATVIHQIKGLSDAVEQALEFYRKYPEETLIIVTADHETGGLSIGWAGKQYNTDLIILKNQKVSLDRFSQITDSVFAIAENRSFTNLLDLVGKYYGIGTDQELLLNDYELQLLTEAWEIYTQKRQIDSNESYLKFGGLNPLAVVATRILNQKAGIGWTTWAHTAAPVPIFAIGHGHELFNGYYDITDIPKKIRMLMGITP